MEIQEIINNIKDFDKVIEFFNNNENKEIKEDENKIELKEEIKQIKEEFNEEEIKEKDENKEVNNILNYFSDYLRIYYNNFKDKLKNFYDSNKVIVKRVPKYIIGDGVLGRAFVYQNYVEVLDSLSGDDFNRVLSHEMYHINNPQASEYETRLRTGTLYFTPNQWVSVY